MTEEIKRIYDGKPEDFHWVGFGSGSGTNLRECAKVIEPVLIFSDKPNAKLFDLKELSEIEQLMINGYHACGSWKKAQGNSKAMAKYKRKSIRFNQDIVHLLHMFEEEVGFGIDLIVLGGYMRLVEEPLLESYPDKIINIHPSHLPPFGEGDSRIYIGDDAVYDAIKAGELSTKSSVIIVDDGEDHGEILTQGHWVRVNGEFSRLPLEERTAQLRQYVDGTDTEIGHQDRQKEASDWPALTTALKMISEGRIGLGTEKAHFDEWRAVYVDGKPLGYNGFQIGGE
ncbi:hypothetical protein GOV06_02480 [Candidatus Woesearchaeota archaeon]|nr:hypothetical protein [Candidatus Woesearchaeota archaeon]